MSVVNKPGILATLSKVFRDFGINILSTAFSSRVKIGEIAAGFIVADFMDLKVNPDNIKKELEKLGDVKKVVMVTVHPICGFM
ncbi:MAG: ACT domain-containing protein [Thermoproteales archaeon]|nr:ACT domain-containing protein [Thermoproteales archaeon]